MSLLPKYEVFGYKITSLIIHWKENTFINFILANTWVEKCDFCKKWLIFRVFILSKIFVRWPKLNCHYNQNHQVSIQNFFIKPGVLHKLAIFNSHFCKIWLNFRISIKCKVFVLCIQLNPHLNQNHRLSTKNFHI